MNTVIETIQPWWQELATVIVCAVIRYFERKKLKNTIGELKDKLNGTA